jgi:hypothetical protein
MPRPLGNSLHLSRLTGQRAGLHQGVEIASDFHGGFLWCKVLFHCGFAARRSVRGIRWIQ